MKKNYFFTLILAFLYLQTSFGQNRYWVAAIAGTWNDPLNWSASSGGLGGASVPAAGNVAIFNASANGLCLLDMAPTIGGITVNGYSGTIDLSTFNLTSTGTNTFTTGTITTSGGSVVLNTAAGVSSTFNGTTFDADVSGTSGRIYFNGSSFTGTVNVTKSDTNTDNGTGGNTFNSSVTLTVSGSGTLQMAGTNPDTFVGALTLNINSTGSIALARVAANNIFGNNILINYNSTGGVSFGAGNGTSALAVTRTISVASYGASGCGNLSLAYFTQTGPTAQTITLAGNNSALLTFGPSTTFNGNLNATSPDLILQTSIFSGTTQITKTGNTESDLRGGNTFNGTTTITNQGADLMFGHVSTDPGDTFFSDVTFNNTGGNRIRVPEQSAGTVFHGTVNFNCTSSTDVNNRIQVSRLTGAQATFNGPVYFNNSGNGSDVHISYDAGSSTTFNGPVYFTSNATNGAEYFIGNLGTVSFTNDIEFSSTCADVIYMSYTSGAVTFGNGNMSIGAGGFAQGQLRLQNFTQTGTATQSLTLTGTSSIRLGPSSTLGGATNIVSPQVYLNGCTFQGTTVIEKNGATANTGSGSNVFNGITTLINSGSGAFITGSTSTDIFNNDLTLTNTGSAYISLAESTSGNIFGGNIVVNSTSGSGIYFCNNSGATASLSSGHSITVGSTGFSAGELRLLRFTQLGSTAQSLTFTGTASLKVGPGTTFNGNVNFISPQVYLNGATFGGTANIEKNGATDNTSNGGNTFSGVTTIVNSGSGSLETANTSPDTYATTLTVTNSGSNRIQLGLSSAGNVYGGNVTLNHFGTNAGASNFIVARNSGCTATFGGSLTLNCNCAGTNTGIIIGYDGTVNINGNVTVSSTAGRGVLFGNNTGSVTLGNGYSISAGTFSTGILQLKSFTQAGSTAQNVALTGTANLTLGPSAAFNGNINFISPQVYLSGATYFGTTSIEKNGATTNTGTGSNIFHGVTTLKNSGSGDFISGNTSNDVFNNDLTLINTGSASINMADNSNGNIFGGNIVVNSTSGNGVYFCYNGGSATLSSGKTITIGSSGFTIGDLRLQRFTQSGTTAQSLALTGTSRLILGPSSQFDGNVNFVAPQLYLHGATYGGTAYLEKTGATDNNSNGGNTFSGTTSIVNSGSGYMLSANNSADTFDGQLTLTNKGSNYIYMAHNVAGTNFNGDIIVNATSGLGIVFANNSTGGATLASGVTISVGGLGFNAGELRLKRFTQLGGTPQSITLTGTATIRTGPSTTFNGAATFIAPHIFLDGTTFNSTATIQKNATGNNDSVGGNVFSGTTSITNSSTSRVRLSNSTADAFNGDVTFVRSNTGAFEVAYAQVNDFGGNITVNSTSGIAFGTNGGTMRMTGSNTQTISKIAGSASPTIPNLTMAKTSNTLTLNTDITISTTATFTTGIINTTSSNYLNFADNAIVSGANDASYVDGPVRKTGNDAFTFPVGNSNFYRPISMSAPSNTAHHFTAQYFKAAQPYGGPSTWDPSFTTISGCEYWVLDRTNGTSNVSVTLGWNSTSCGSGYVNSMPDVRVARFNTATSRWVDEGNGGTSGSTSSGTVVSAAAVTTFSPFAVASVDLINPLPVELGQFWAVDLGNSVQLKWITYSEENNESFSIQRSSTGFDFVTIAEQQGAGNSKEQLTYSYIDGEPLGGISYYRLKQKDFDGKESFSNIISIKRKGEILAYMVYPNPAGDEVVRFNQRSNIVVINSLNQVIMTIKEAESLDASQLATGMYVIKGENGQVTRLIKK
jgi:hypothetical protein